MAKLICTIDLDKEKGLTVTVEDPDGKLTQTVMLDGKSITLEVKNDSDRSTIVQKPDSISITCKDFKLDAETLTLESKKASKWESKETLDLTSTKDMVFKSEAKLTQEAAQDAALCSQVNLKLEGAQEFTLEGGRGKVSATTDTLELEGPELKLKGTSQADLGAPLIKVAAKGKLGLESVGVAELKGNMTSVSGGSVTLG